MSRDVRQTGRGGMRRVEKNNLDGENCYTKPERLECACFRMQKEINHGWREGYKRADGHGWREI